MSKSPGLDNRSRRRGFLSCVSALDIGKIVEILTHHLCYQHDAGQILGLIFSYKLAVTEDCDPVAYRVYLLQEMCYENNSNALVSQSAHQDEQFLNLVVVQRGGRLIQDQYPAFHIYRTGNSDHLLNGHGTLVQHLGRRHVNIQTLQKLCGTGVHFTPVYHSQLSGLTSDKKILRHRQVRTEVYLLVHGTDAVRLRFLRRMIDHVSAASLHMDASAFKFMHAGKHLDQR